jgi:hypothetical protein
MVVVKIFVVLLIGLLSIRAEKVRFWGRFAQPSTPWPSLPEWIPVHV